MGGMACALAAPAIVHAGNLMPVKALDPILFSHNPWWNGEKWIGELDYDAMIAITRQTFIPLLHAQLYRSNPLFHKMTNFTVDGEWM
jgi:hypothetical protein